MRSEITIDLGALRRNVATLLRALDGAELWAVVKANALRPRRRRLRAAPRSTPARRALCVATVAEALELRARAAGGAHPRARPGVEPRGRRRRATRGSSSSSSSGEIPEGVARAREARHRHGALGRLGAAAPGARGRRRDDASRDRRHRPRRSRALQIERFREATEPRRAPDAPRREQRRRAAAARVALRRGALRDRALRPLAVRQRTPPTDGLEPVLSWTSEIAQATAAARAASRRATAGASSPSATRGSGSCRSATRTASAAT